jgi:hypothetical protein
MGQQGPSEFGTDPLSHETAQAQHLEIDLYPELAAFTGPPDPSQPGRTTGSLAVPARESTTGPLEASGHQNRKGSVEAPGRQSATGPLSVPREPVREQAAQRPAPIASVEFPAPGAGNENQQFRATVAPSNGRVDHGGNGTTISSHSICPDCGHQSRIEELFCPACGAFIG